MSKPRGRIDRIPASKTEQLSKTLSYMLRHKPVEFELELDAKGFAPLQGVVYALRRMRDWRQLTQEEIIDLVRCQSKQRFEIRGNKIRALYGHSVPQEISYRADRPPSILFHGTGPTSLDQILHEGLRPMVRQYVHLSTTPQDAYEIGRRKHPYPIILKIRARAAYQDGIEFFRAGDMILSRRIPPEYIQVIEIRKKGLY